MVDRIPDAFLDELRAMLPVSTVVGRRLQLKKEGREFKALSPFQTEKTPSFTVVDDKQLWKDFSSGKGGDIIAFEMSMTNCTFMQAVETLADMAGLQIPGSKPGGRRSTGGAKPQQQTPQQQDDDHPNAPRESKGTRETVLTYDYTNADGVLLYQVCRVQFRMPDGSWRRKENGAIDKSFAQRQPAPDGGPGWVWGLDAGPYVQAGNGDYYRLSGDRAKWKGAKITIAETTPHGLYRFPELREELSQDAVDQRTVFCYRPDAEVLTPTGWVALPDLAKGTAVAQWETSGRISFVVPTARQALHYCGSMINIASTWCDLFVTADHRQPVRHQRCRWKVLPAAEVGPTWMLPTAGLLHGAGAGPSPAETMLIAAWIADGVRERRGHKVSWNLKKERKKARLRKLLHACEVPFTEHHPKSTPGWTGFRVKKTDLAFIWKWAPEKRWTWETLSWPLASRQTVLNELQHWDGDSCTRNTRRYFTSDPQSADVICAIASCSGWGAAKRIDSRRGSVNFVVNLSVHSARSISRQPTALHYDGPVYCCTVPSSFLVIRQNGKVAVSGNCPEGEKDCDTLADWGLVATDSSGGSKKWSPHHAEQLLGADVVILMDNDQSGREYAHKKAASLRGIARRVRVLDWRQHWATCPDGGDTTDWRDHAGGSKARLFEIIDTLPDWTPEAPQSLFNAVRFIDLDKPARELEWLIKKILTRGEVSIWYGPPGCVDGDAMLTVNRGGNGRQMRLRDLVNCFNGTSERGRSGRKWRHDIPTMVRCFIDGEFRLRQVLGAYPKGIKPVLRMTLVNGFTIRVTADHEILTGAGWKRADQIMVGERVTVSGSPVATLSPKQKPLPFAVKRAGRYLDKKGYWWVCRGLKHHPFFGGLPYESYDMPEHRLVAEARMNGLSLAQWLDVIRRGAFLDSHVFLTRQQHVHHGDEDTTNNAPDNLIVLTQSEHSKHHRFQRHLPMFQPALVAVRSVVPDGATEVFDITVAEAHNFVANDIVVHNCGKSFLITDAAMAVARGQSWMGLRCRQGLAVYQAGEGGLGLKKRLRAYRRHHGIRHDLDVPFVLLPSRVDLFSQDDHTDKLIGEIKAWAAFYDAPLELVVIDTFSAASPGANENASEDVSKVLQRCHRIAVETGAHVALVHHTPKLGGSPRGHSSLMGNVENAVEVIRTENVEAETTGDNRVMRDIREMVIRKQKDGEDGLTRRFVLKQVHLGMDADQEPDTSCIVAEIATAAGQAAASSGGGRVVPVGYVDLKPNNQLIMRALVDALKVKGQTVPDGINAPNNARACTVGDWIDALVAIRYSADIDDPDSKRLRATCKKAVERTYAEYDWAGAKNLIGKDKEWVWRTYRKVNGIDAPPVGNDYRHPNAPEPAGLLAPGEDQGQASLLDDMG